MWAHAHADGSDELRFHVRDEEAAVAGLPSSLLMSLAGLDITRVELAILLDDATELWAQVVAGTAVRREQLLAAVATLERVESDG